MYHDVPALHAGLSMNRTRSYKSPYTASSLNRLQDIRYWPTRMSSLFFFCAGPKFSIHDVWACLVIILHFIPIFVGFLPIQYGILEDLTLVGPHLPC